MTRPPSAEQEASSPKPDTKEGGFGDKFEVVLVGTLKSGNIGSTARAMKNMGLTKLSLVRPQNYDPESARWMAPNCGDVLEHARVLDSLDAAIAGCTWVIGVTARKRRHEWQILDPRQTAVRAFDNKGRVALVFGPEDHGLDNDSLLRCHTLLQIPTALAHSLNLAQAVLIVCHHLLEEARERGLPLTSTGAPQRTPGGDPHNPAVWEQVPKGSQPAPVEAQAEVVERALQILDETAYLKGQSRDKVQTTLNQLLQRSTPSEREIFALLSMLDKTRWRLDHPNDD